MLPFIVNGITYNPQEIILFHVSDTIFCNLRQAARFPLSACHVSVFPFISNNLIKIPFVGNLSLFCVLFFRDRQSQKHTLIHTQTNI